MKRQGRRGRVRHVVHKLRLRHKLLQRANPHQVAPLHAVMVLRGGQRIAAPGRANLQAGGELQGASEVRRA